MTKVAKISMNGFADARPTLQIGDIVLLRPRLRGPSVSHHMTYSALEIESRILGVIRSKRDEKDQILFTWGLNHHQTAVMGNAPWETYFNVRFVPSASSLERCLTALDWIKNVSIHHPQALNDVLFPLEAPKVKSLKGQQSIRLKHDASDTDTQLNELQSSFVRMVRARTLDSEYTHVRPPMILTGPAGTGMRDLYSFLFVKYMIGLNGYTYLTCSHMYMKGKQKLLWLQSWMSLVCFQAMTIRSFATTGCSFAHPATLPPMLLRAV